MEVFLIVIFAVFGFGILVFFHEAGHFIVAKLFGVKVERFAIGWGPKLVGFKYKDTIYQISVFPIGGFCQFKGDNVNDELDDLAKDPDSFYGTASYKRLLIAFAGPFMNFLIAVIMFMILALGSQDVKKIPSQVLLVDDVYSKFSYEFEHSPAYKSGLKTKDKIVAINGKTVSSFDDITRKMIYNGKKTLTVTILRDITSDSGILEQQQDIIITPDWEPSQMKAVIGVYYYLPPIVSDANENPVAKYLGLQNGDEIIAINGDKTNITDIYINQFISQHFAQDYQAEIMVRRNEDEFPINIVFNDINHKIDQENCYLNFDIPLVHIPGKNIFAAFWDGLKQSADVIGMSAIGLHSMIFMPKSNIKQQVGGPIRIGQMIGQATIIGFKTSVVDGLRNFIYVISIISLALAFFNLLPLPAVDGGHVVLCLIEIIIGRKLKLKVLYYINIIGLGLLVMLSILIAYVDISNLMM